MITWVVFLRMFWNFISSLPVKKGGSLSFLVGTIRNVLVMEIGWTDVRSGWYILVSCAHSNTSLPLLYPPLPEGGKGYTVLPLSVLPSSKKFFVVFFSVTVDGRNLIFGHKCHVGMPYCGKRFWTHQIPVCWFCWFLYTFNIHLYMHIFCHIFLSNYWWQ